MQLEHEYNEDYDDRDDEDVEDIEIISPALKDKLRSLVEARQKRDAAKTQWQKDKDDCEKIELEVFDMFEKPDANGDPQIKGTLKVPLGEPYGTVAFRTREQFFAKIIDEDEIHEWYENRARLEEVSHPKFVMKHLNNDLRTRLEQGEEPMPGTTYTTQRGMTITTQKS